MGSIEPAHSSQYVKKTLCSITLTVSSLPQVENGFSRTGSGGEKCDVSVDVESLGQHPPVIAQGHRGVQHPGQRLLGLTWKTERGGASVGVVTGTSAGAGPHLVLPVARPIGG